jgi:RHS repeat-associated protein
VEKERLAREKNLGMTFYGWDGNTLAWETTNEQSTHYFYEPDSFIPLAQAVKNRPMQMHPTPDWSNRDYKVKEDPLWTQVLEPEPFDKLGFYHCDHLGTPQEITDEEGNIAWSAQYKAWGEAKELLNKTAQNAGFKNPLRFQGQYFDHETGLHYNRFRYYDPETGRFISKDPIKFEGGLNLFQYVPNPIDWIDPWGLKYKSQGRSPNVIGGKDKATASTQNITEWRRKICVQNIAMEIEKFLGNDFVKVGDGKWRSLDGTRQFRVTPADYTAKHGIGNPTVPGVPHVHFEFLTPTGQGNFRVTKNVHVPLDKSCHP